VYKILDGLPTNRGNKTKVKSVQLGKAFSFVKFVMMVVVGGGKWWFESEFSAHLWSKALA